MLGLLIFIIVIVIVMLIIMLDNNYTEFMDNVSGWTTDKKCIYEITPVYLDIFKEYSIIKKEDDNWLLYIPCTYNNIDEEIESLNPTNNVQKIFMVTNSNEIASKSDLWINTVANYGRENAKLMMPTTYVLYDPNDLELFKSEFSLDRLYIMKKNIQRQEGIKITNNKDTILNGFKDDYVVAQELLQDPYTVNGRKINLRVYVLAVCQNNKLSLYVHKEGFLYYTKQPFKKQSMDLGDNITTGYIDRWVYHVNPLTHSDFRKYLDEKSDIAVSDRVFNRIYNLIKNSFKTVDTKICSASKLSPYTSFQLFGADIALDQYLNPKIMEFNIGPSLEVHDERDSEVKHTVVRDIFKVLEVIPDENNGFVKII